MTMGRLLAFPRAGAEDARTDDELARACAAGDAMAQALVFQRHAPTLLRFVARMCGSHAGDVEDLLQLAFLAAFRSAASFRGPRLSSWLYGVAANVVRAHARKERSRRRVDDAFAEASDREAPAVDADLPRLRAAIAALPHELRVLVVLVDLEGERGADVAAGLDIAESTLWARLAKARAQLRAALAGGAA